MATQAYFLEPEGSLRDGTDRTYNLRKINELPYHLLHAQLAVELKMDALLNFEWILAKLCGTSLRDLLDEYSMVIQVRTDTPPPPSTVFILTYGYCCSTAWSSR